MRGRFIVLECVDSVVLSQQANLLDKWLRSQVGSGSVIFTREPTDGPIGSLARLVLDGRLAAEPQTQAAMFLADRLDHLYGYDDNTRSGILQELDAGTYVICMRYLLSAYAYQGSEITLDWLRKINRPCPWPDLMIFIDSMVEKWLDRQVGLQGFDRIEILKVRSQELAAQREQYLHVIDDCHQHSQQVLVVDGNLPAQTIHEYCRKAVERIGVER